MSLHFYNSPATSDHIDTQLEALRLPTFCNEKENFMKQIVMRNAALKTSLVAMAAAGVFASTASNAANTPDAYFAFSWDGSDILVNNNVSNADEQSFVKNADGSITAKVSQITVENNFPNGVLGNYAKDSSGGKIMGKDLTIKNSTFEDNGTHFDGNVIFLTVSGATGTDKYTHRIEGTTFKNNKMRAIGVIYEEKFEVLSEMEVVNSRFENNQAGDGGAMYLDPYIVSISDSEFVGNKAVSDASGDGGAIKSYAQRLTMTDVLFKDNSAVNRGGALYMPTLPTDTKPGAPVSAGHYINVVGEDLTYSGNHVTGSDGQGGFVYMGGNADLTLNIADGRTLTIGEAGVVDAKTDSFATEDDTARMVKEGAGTMMINSSMEDFNGAFDVAQGNVRIATLNMPGVLSADAEEGSAVVTIDKVAGDKLEATVNARRNGMVVIGSDEASVRSAMQKSGVTGDHGVIYVGQTLDMSGGSLVVGTGLDTVVDGSVVATNGGVLMVDQTAGTAEKPIFSNASVTIDADSTLTLVNASVGTINLADGALTVNGDITTDNPFIEGSIVDGQLVSALNAQDGLTSIASTGIQAMARRADFVMAQTIADRTAFDQERAQGVRLWVDVTGERYEADSLDNGGNFRADAGYAAFGGDLDASSDWVVGAAMQYGTGSLRSDVANIKNDITSYGLTGYASKKFGDWKVVGELAYLQSENEITSSQAALNVDVDAQVYSAGIRAQYELTAGSFAFIPSVGLRVSRLETDAFNVNTVRVDDQNQTLVQMPIALRITAADLNADGWSVAPNLKLAFVPTFGDKEIKMAGIEQTVIDTSPVQADFGILARKGNMTLNAGMLLGGGKDGTSSIGGKVGLSYAF